MTGQALLDRMELANAELQLQLGEADQTRGLVALNVAQDHFEAQLAVQPNTMGDTTGTVVTANGVEYTTYPAGLLRIDRLWLLDANGKPISRVDPLSFAGEHSGNGRWPYGLLTVNSPGAPCEYETDGSKIWWSPLPDAVYTVRWYGFQVAADITASGTFAYPDIVAFPLAVFAAKVLKIGVDDDSAALTSLAAETFSPVIEALANFNRDGASGLDYTRLHIT